MEARSLFQPHMNLASPLIDVPTNICVLNSIESENYFQQFSFPLSSKPASWHKTAL